MIKKDCTEGEYWLMLTGSILPHFGQVAGGIMRQKEEDKKWQQRKVEASSLHTPEKYSGIFRRILV